MDNVTWTAKIIEYVGDNEALMTVVASAVIAFVTTGVISFARRPTTASQGGTYFTDTDLLTPPKPRPAYSDRTAYILAELSALAYFEFEGADGALQKAVDKFLEIGGDSGGGIETQVRALLKDFRDVSLVKTIDSQKFLKEILKKADFDLIETINIQGTQAFVCKRNKAGEAPYLVVAFRGTEMEIGDWLTDVHAIPVVDTQADTKVHGGFFKALTENRDQNGKSVLERVKEIVAGETAKAGRDALPCFFTGHSLGGALALLTTKEIALDINGACYTFGGPRVADYNYFKFMKTPVFRVVNSADIVPRVPPGAGMGIVLKLVQGLGWLTRFIPAAREPLKWLERKVDQLNGYRHFGDLRYLTDVKSGKFHDVRLLPNPPMIDRVWWMWQHIRKSFMEPVKSHGMAIYRCKLQYIATTRNASAHSSVETQKNATPQPQ